MNNHSYKWMDGIKGICACMIAFIWHYQHAVPLSSVPFYNYFSNFYESCGDFLLEIFFMLSGFGMVLGYEKRILDGNVSFDKYIKKRIARIFPLMIIALIITTILQAIFVSYTGASCVYEYFDIYHFFLNLYGVTGTVVGGQLSFNGPAWYLGVVVVLYAVYYVVVSLCKDRISIENMMYLYLAIALLGIVSFAGFDGTYILINEWVRRGIACFFTGCFLAKLDERLKADNKKRTVVGYCAFAIVVICCSIAHIYGPVVWGNTRLAFMVGMWPLIIISMCCIPWLSRIASLKFFTWLGSISFGIYLFHFPVQVMIKDIEFRFLLPLNHASIKMWLIYIVLVFAVAILMTKLDSIIQKKIVIK